MCKGKHEYNVTLSVKSLFHNDEPRETVWAHGTWKSARTKLRMFVGPKRVKLNQWYTTKGGNRAKIARSCLSD